MRFFSTSPLASLVLAGSRAAGVVGSLAAVLVVGSAVVACGRSAEEAFACPAVGDDCAAIANAQQSAEAAYAVAADARDADQMDATAQCVQQHVDAAVDGACVDRCDELCRLHPCNVLDEAGAPASTAQCPARCATLRADGAFSNDDLDLAVFKAAENPGFCTCRACTAFDDALCTQLFTCAAAKP